ncbi:MAG: FtsK/SpoIIIE family DNA translocase [Planctomycetota bacterium]
MAKRKQRKQQKQRRFVPVEHSLKLNLSQRGREILGLLWIGFSLYVLLAMATFAAADAITGEIPRGGVTNLGGSVGYHAAAGLLWLFGLAGYLPFFFLIVFSLLMFLGHEVKRLTLKAIGVVTFTALVATLMSHPDGATAAPLYPDGAGGKFGAAVSAPLQNAFGGPGRLLLLLFGALTSFLLATEWVFSQVLLWAAAGLQRVGGWLRRGVPTLLGRWRRARTTVGLEPDGADRVDAIARAAEKEDSETEDAEEEDAEEDDAEDHDTEAEDEAGYDDEQDEEEEDEEEDAPDQPEAEVVLPAGKPRRQKPAKVLIRRPQPQPREQQPLPFDAAYTFPPIELFQEPMVLDTATTEAVIRRNADAIERRLGSFKIEARVVGVSPGPAVTQYEIRVAEGIKVTRIVSYEADLAAALKAVSVRVVAPIPGKDTVGIEVPNHNRQIVVLRELLESHRTDDSVAIPLFLGRDVNGRPIVEDLAEMPHLLIAGTTGSGKSVSINAILLAILMTRTPRQVRLILLDPKMVELQSFKTVPHLACPVVTSMKKAPGVLDWAVDEMDTRYQLLSDARVKNIRSFNQLGQVELEKRLGRPVAAAEVEMPHLVLVIDELADLMAVAANEVEDSIQRLAQKSRAVGVHVILATQRPSTDVITGVIKANLPCIIAFKVARKVDSRVILDQNGAEKLLGHGDMLYIAPGAHQMVRAQGTYVAAEEIHRVVDYLQDQGQQPSFLPALVQRETASGRRPAHRDDLYEEAVEVILGQQRGSATLLQRSLSVGYTRATRLLELMEQDAIVGPFNGSRSRDVLLTLDEWRAREEAVADELDAVVEASVDAPAADQDATVGAEAAAEEE